MPRRWRTGPRSIPLDAVPQNYRDVSHEKLFSGQQPTRVVVGLVDNRAFNGHLENKPFNFKHYNLSEISLYLDGHQQFALKPIQPDYKDEGLFISREDYCDGYALYTFDLTADLGEDDHFNLLKQGNVRSGHKICSTARRNDKRGGLRRI